VTLRRPLHHTLVQQRRKSLQARWFWQAVKKSWN